MNSFKLKTYALQKVSLRKWKEGLRLGGVELQILYAIMDLYQEYKKYSYKIPR